jgi:hypothetical protein
MSPAPNLFDLGPSELAQDAFLSWLVAHAGHPDRPDLHAAAKAFIAMLWNAAKKPERTGPADIALIEDPKRQKEKIDIIFSASVRGVPTMFVIEDKTDTSHHSNQLDRYRMWTEGAYKDHQHVFIYLKTGFHFDEDRAAATHRYTVVTLDEVVECLNAHPATSDIFNEYLAHAKRLLVDRAAVLDRLTRADGYPALRYDFAQFTLLSQLRNACTSSIGCEVSLHRGRNVGGAPWTHLRFANFPDRYGAKRSEVLYHRVDIRQDDAGKRRYYLCTRQYAKVKDDAHARAEKRKWLTLYRDLFKGACAAVQSKLSFSTPTTDNRGANESEVGILFFDAEANSIANVVEQFPLVHAAFVERLQQDRR